MTEKFIILLIEAKAIEEASILDAFNQLWHQGIEFEVMAAKTLFDAQQILRAKTHFDLIITELSLPESDAIDMINAIQEEAIGIPIIATSKFTDQELIRQIIRLGAQDFLPFQELDPEHLQRVIYSAIERNRLRQSLHALSFTDEVTALYNRRGFITLLERQISLANRTGQGFYLFILDLDYLKSINDTYGHSTGDRALKDVADCLTLAFRHHDIIGRIGGDEFGVIAINAPAESKEHLEKMLYDTLEDFNKNGGAPYKLSLSFGAVYYSPEGELTMQELIDMADFGLYASKRDSHNKKD